MGSEVNEKSKPKPVVPPLDLTGLTKGTPPQQPTVKVDRLLQTVGRRGTIKIGTNRGGKPKVEAPGKTQDPKAQMLERQAYWMNQINAMKGTIGKEIGALELIPEQLRYANGFRRRLGSAQLPKAPEIIDLRSNLDELKQLQIELHLYLSESQGKLKQKFSDTAAARKEYELTHGKLEEVERALEAYPASVVGSGDPEGKSYVAAIIVPQRKVAEQHYDLTHFPEALAKIKEVYKQANEHLKDLKEREDGFTVIVGTSPFKKSKAALEELQKQIELLTPEIGEVATDPFQLKHDNIYATMLRAMKSKSRPSDTDVEKIITSSQAELLQTTETRRDLRRQVMDSIKRVDTVIAKNGPIRPQTDVETANEKVDAARSLIATFDFAGAKKKIGEAILFVGNWEVLPDLGDPTRKEAIGKQGFKLFVTPAKAALETAKKQLALVAAAPILDTPPSVQSVVDMLEFQLGLYTGAPDEYPIGQGIDALKLATAQTADNQQRYDDYMALEKARGVLAGKIKVTADRATSAIDEFKKILENAGTSSPRLMAYDVPFETAMAEWAAALERVTNEDELTDTFDTVTERLEALRARVEQDASDPEKLIDATLDAKLSAIDKAFGEADTAAGLALAELTESNYELGDACSVSLDKARKEFVAARKARNVSASQNAIETMKKLALDADKQTEAAELERAKVKRAFHELNSEISVTLAKLKLLGKDSKFAAYLPILEVVTQKQIMIGRVGASSDPSVITIAIADLEALKAELQKVSQIATKLFDKNAKKDPNDLTIENLNDRLKKLDLKDDAVKVFEATALAEIAKKKATIEGNVGKILLTETQQQIADLDKEWVALKATAATHKQDVADFRNDVALTLSSFKQTVDKKEYAAYHTAMKGRLAALDQAADKQKQVDKKALEEIKAEIARDQFGGKAGMKLANDNAEVDALAEDLAKKQWMADLAAFNGKLKALDAVAKNITDPAAKKAFLGQKQQTEDAVAEIKGRAKKGKPSYTQMSEQLLALVSNINNMIRYPLGLETHARGEIMKTVDAWDKEVGLFHDLLDSLPDAIGKAMDKDPRKNEVVGAVNSRIASLKRVVMANTIRPWAKEVVDAGEDKAKARQAREMALREVARLRSLVEGTAFKPTALNAFKVDVLIELSALSASLFDVETNLTISL